MMCAGMASEACFRHELEVIAKEKAEAERLRKELEDAKNEAVFLCEHLINDMIEERANAGYHSCYFQFCVEEIAKVKYCRQLKLQCYYADGRRSEYADGKRFSLKEMIEYLENNCFKVQIEKDGHWLWGCGWQNKDIKITISW